jgi:hypothetical protein
LLPWSSWKRPAGIGKPESSSHFYIFSFAGKTR